MLFSQLTYRRFVVISQALTAVCVCLLHQIWLNGDKDIEDTIRKLQLWTKHGALITVHSFLSCYQEEKGS